MEWVILAVAIVVVLVIAVAGLVVPRRRGTTLPPAPEKAVPPLGADTEAAETAVLTEPEARPGAEPEPGARPGEGTLVDTTGPGLEVPEAAAGRMVRLRSRLARSQSTLGRGLLSLLSRQDLDEDAWEEVEDTLLAADVGVGATREIVDRLRTRTKVLGTRSEGELRALLADELVTALQPDMDRTLHTVPHADGHPAVLLVVGVNGTGKTTTCGKIARLLVADGRTVLLAAADTFRAAAADQLETWAGRVGARVVRGPEGGDPASVAFDAVKLGTESDDNIGVDTVIVDTAGRLHTKVGLMDELGKVKRVVEKQGPVDETLLVLDATTGQNGVVQARVFTEAVDVTGIVLTKLDGTAKGGIVVSVQRELGVPVKLVGLGEGPDDLAPFEPETFVDALLGETV